ncbi:hypothetical protein BK004_04460 [bacterium CG10_46_32]|nr:MAG: hypothetical protein BK004_04460 [bacterium CG10_46_32]PIR55762.1 MAG: hypothetical protein COU73_04500 [Parcubacteria group bacterium CG10_big_fil_rev_8_21_14_0_10_46_32]
MPACCAEERGAKTADQNRATIDENMWALGKSDERLERFFWLMRLEKGLPLNQVVIRAGTELTDERGDPIRSERTYALKRLYEVRETPAFTERFAQYIRMM